MVECKAWDRPVDKEVLAKAAFVGADVGADKTIVVALQGATGGATLSAAELGVELWGPDELERRLGRVLLADLGAARRADGARLRRGRRRGARRPPGRAAARQGRARHRGRGGRLVRPALAALPAAHAGLHAAAGPPAQARPALVGLQSLRGARRHACSRASPPIRPSGEVEARGHRLAARVKARALRTEIATTFDKWRSVVQGAARERWERAALRARHAPAGRGPHGRRDGRLLPAGLRRRPRQRDARRVVVIDGGDGALDTLLSSVFTANLGYLTEALDPRP